MERNYSIHDIVTFKIINKNRKLTNLLNNIELEYRTFRCDRVENPDFIVYIGNFEPSNENCYVLDDQYYVKEDYFYCDGDSYKIVRWKFEMSGFEKGQLIIRISTNIIGKLFMSSFLINFIILFKFIQKGYSIVHASGLSKAGEGYLFAATSGGGKTTIALKLIEEGFSFMGDNYIILHNNYVMSFLSLINIFTYNIAPIVKRNLSIWRKASLTLRNLLYKVTLGYAKLFMQIDPREIFSQSLNDRSKLNVIFHVIPRKSEQRLAFKVKRIDKKELIEHLVANQKLELAIFNKYIVCYSFIFPESNLSRFWSAYKKTLIKNIPNNILTYKIIVPVKYDSDMLEKISELVEDHVR